MAISAVVTRGFGAGGSIALVVARGYALGDEVAPPAATDIDRGGAHHYEISDPRHPYWQRRIEVEDEAAPVAEAAPAAAPAPRAPEQPKPPAELFIEALKRAIGADAPIPVPPAETDDTAAYEAAEAEFQRAMRQAHESREVALLEAVLLAEMID